MSCELDHIRSFLLKECLLELLSVLTNIATKSLDHVEMPRKVQKIRNNCKETNYRKNCAKLYTCVEHPICVNWTVCVHLTEHMLNSGLNEPSQSAYRVSHGPKTALVKVFDSIFSHLDSYTYIVFALRKRIILLCQK